MKKKSKMKRFLVSLLTGSIVFSSMPPTEIMLAKASADFRAEDSLLAHYPLETGTEDVSGGGRDGTIPKDAQGANFNGDALEIAGGDKNSKNYMALPEGLFDGQNTLTISLWIKNNNTAGNYSAFFFGSKAEGNNMPSNYFLLNPAQGKVSESYYKAVVTNRVNQAAPYQTEVGINSDDKASTTEYMNQWALYTISVKEGEISAYLNGELKKTAVWDRKVSDFGDNLVSYIGKSEYLLDSLFTGSFRDLRIYDKVLNAEEVQKLYQIGTRRNRLLEAKEGLSLNVGEKVIADVELPIQGAYNTDVSWSSSNPSVMTADGKVTIRSQEQKVTLTAVLTLDGDNVKKEFPLVVAGKDSIAAEISGRVQIPYEVTEDKPLPTEFEGGITVEWVDSTGVVSRDGTITASDKNQQLQLTALISQQGAQRTEKEFTILVMEKTAEYVMSYTRKNVDSWLGQSMHLGLSGDGENYTALHNNTGILFAKAELDGFNAGTTRTLQTPYLFRLTDERIGILAIRDDGNVLQFETSDLMEYGSEKILDLHTDLRVSDLRCQYNGQQYEITWKGPDGKWYRNMTVDFQTIDSPKEITFHRENSITTTIANAVPCNVLPVTKAEADMLRTKLMPLENTGVVQKTYAFSTKAGQELTEEDTKNSTITAQYNDGTTDEIPIVWDDKSVNYNREGQYEITGSAKLTQYPVLDGRADPNIYQYNGKYYFIATGETQSQSQICIREADTPAGLFNAKDHELLRNTNTPNWAPELHEISGKLYIFLSIGGSWQEVQSQIMELKEGGNPTVKEDWKAAKKVTRQDGSALYDSGITLDMTYFEVNGIHYVSWAQRQIAGEMGTSDLWIGTIDPGNPYKLTSEPVCILRNQYGWDRIGTTVDEGPYVVEKNGKVWMTFSGSSVSDTYLVGLLSADPKSNLLDAGSWKETNYPILTAESIPGERGPGHSCFSVDEDGRDIFVYHMKPNGGTRSASVRRVHWAPDGSPVLDMTIDKELKEEYRTVTATVTVTGNQEFDENEGLLARYKLEADVKDSSGNENNGEILGGESTFREEALSLPGGSKPRQNYAVLPEGMFDGQDAVTVSMWIKNNNTKMNTSAFSFGGTAKTGSYPKHYFLLNPSNPDGYYKAVFTDPVQGSTANPWTTEVGINNSGNNSILTSDRMNQWLYYTVTIDKEKITAYLNGSYIGEDRIKNVAISDFGKNLETYIGASGYGDDTFAGDFRDLRIYSRVLSGSDAAQLFAKALQIQKVKEAKLSLNIGDGLTVISNLQLPNTQGDCRVTWESDNTEVVEQDGTVHFQKNETQVTLKASVRLDGYTEERSFVLKVASEQGALEGKYRTALSIPAYLSENLQKQVNGENITWSCDQPGLLDADGTLHRPENENQQVTIKAVIGQDVITKQAVIMAEGGELLSYVIQGGNLYANEGDFLAPADSRRSDALFLAAKDGQSDSYEPLNKGKAVLYVKWDGDQKTDKDNQMGAPTLFRKADGSLSAAASGNNSKNGIYVWDTEENLAFVNERFLEIAPEGTAVKNPILLYDVMSEAYKIFWQDAKGEGHVSLMLNLEKGTTPVQTTEAEYTKTAPEGNIPENAVKEEVSVFRASALEYEAVTQKYGTVYNTGVEAVNITAKPGVTVTMPQTVKALYNDGSTKNLGVAWMEEDLQKLEPGEEGVYEITGQVQQDAYEYPFIEDRADPHVFYNEDDGYYYSTGSYYEAGLTSPDRTKSYRKLDIRRAETIEGLKTAQEHYILESEVGDQWGSFIWAPEFHKINGTWYCIVGAHNFGSAGIQSETQDGWCSNSILIPYEGTEEQLKAGGMLDSSQWGEPIIMDLPAPANASFDVSYYEEEGGQGYYVIPLNAKLYIVKAAGGDGVIPQPEGTPVEIKSGEWPWEYGIYEGSVTAQNPEGNDQLVVEGPYLFEYGDKVYISYSAATVDKFYALGLMMADKGSDILNPDSWTNMTYPLLSSYDTYEGQIGGGAHAGGGHNSIVLDEYGNLALVYHARPYPDPHTGQAGAGGLFDPCRHTVVKSVNVAADGTLIFNMTADEELNPEFKTVIATVTISADAKLDKSGLAAAVKEAQAIDTDKYTDETAEIFEKALIKAEEVLADESLTASQQYVVDEAQNQLKEAMDNLVQKEQKPEEDKKPEPDKKPEGGKTPDAVKTGDTVSTAGWLILLAITFGTAVVCRTAKKRYTGGKK